METLEEIWKSLAPPLNFWARFFHTPRDKLRSYIPHWKWSPLVYLYIGQMAHSLKNAAEKTNEKEIEDITSQPPNHTLRTVEKNIQREGKLSNMLVWYYWQ